MCYTRSRIILYPITDVATHLSPETFSSIRFTTPLPKTKLANIVKSPAMPVWMKVFELRNRRREREKGRGRGKKRGGRGKKEGGRGKREEGEGKKEEGEG